MESIERFLNRGDGFGFGNGDGDGDCNGDGNGDGFGFGFGFGNGFGNGDGDCNGDGNGDGDGNGFGDGFGFGNGNGFGFGCGCGNGNGNGDGFGFKRICGYDVHRIDGVPTIIYSVRGNIARGATIRHNSELVPCYIAKDEYLGLFAHGATGKEAYKALLDKAILRRPIEERIAEFLKAHNTSIAYPAQDLFDWHHRLTGSCEFGRREFCKRHGIDVESDFYTISEFVELTKNDYGGNIILQLGKVIEETRGTARHSPNGRTCGSRDSSRRCKKVLPKRIRLAKP